MLHPSRFLTVLVAALTLGCRAGTRPVTGDVARGATRLVDAPGTLACRSSVGPTLATNESTPPTVTPVRWISAYDARERGALDRWCAGVGPAVTSNTPTSAASLSGSAMSTTVSKTDSATIVIADSIDVEPVGPAIVTDSVVDTLHVDSTEQGTRAPRVEVPSVEVPVVTAPVAGSGVSSKLVVVTWNTHVGGADIAGLVRDLREGKLTNGERVEHFVLLLQEVYRASAEVPFGVKASVPKPIHTVPHVAGAHRVDIVETARALGVQLFYVPSMANGRTVDGLPEDRGNAILSTLPLRDLAAIELPYEAQRRVAAAATVSGVDAHGKPWSLRLVNVHLDNKSRAARLLQSLGGARTRQAKALVSALGDESAVVVGGDVNTWGPRFMEGTDEVLRAHFPLPASQPPEPTFQSAGLRLDRLMFRLPPTHEVETRRLADRRGSDHHPLIGVVTFK